MKKLKIYFIFIFVLIFCLSLVGCAGKNIEFKEENVACDLNNEYAVGMANFQMVNKIASVDEMKNFFNTEYFGMNTADKLTMFDDKYFDNNTLLLVCYLKFAEEKYEITQLSIKGTELFVTIQRVYYDQGKRSYSYKFITVDKDSVKNVEKLSYIITSK